MKIGIITFHCADNYGAVLQTLALYNKLMRLFATSDIYVVDYRPRSIIKEYSLLRIRNIRQLISSILQLPFLLRRKSYFNKFRDMSLKLLPLKDINRLEYLVCGSDQIWNSEITKGLDLYFFGIIKGFQGKLIAYAASDGGNLTNIEVRSIQSYLTRFEFLSVREKTMLTLLNEYQKNISVVLDPVFLLDRTFWQKIASNQKYSNYILVYQLGHNDNLFKDAYQLAAQTGKLLIEIVYAFPYKRIIKTKRVLKIKHKIFPTVNLPFFLYLFNHADYIFTNSFHGTAFSIIFNRCFYSYGIDNDKKNERIEDLLSEINLQNHFITAGVNNFDPIDYCVVNFLLAKKIGESIDFLKCALSYDNRQTSVKEQDERRDFVKNLSMLPPPPPPRIFSYTDFFMRSAKAA
jgi:hypothetical protein